MDSPVETKRLTFESPLATSPIVTHQHDVDPDHLSIQPLLAVPSSSTSFGSLSNHTATGGDGLGDIAEGAEEEETDLVSNTESTVSGSAALATGQGAQDPLLIAPTQIQGLKISTSPIPSSNSYDTPPMMLSPISPLPPYPPAGATVGQPPPSSSGFSSSLPRSRASSISSIGPFQRSESTGGLAISWSVAAAAAAAGGGYASVFTGSEAGDVRETDGGYQSDGGRLPGQPLFPSNFARLATGPKLRTNDLAFKSTNIPLRSKYGSFDAPGGVDKVRAYSDAGVRVKGIAEETKRQSWGGGTGG